MIKSDVYCLTKLPVYNLIYVFRVTGRLIKLKIEREALEQQVILSTTHTRALQLGRALPKKHVNFKK